MDATNGGEAPAGATAPVQSLGQQAGAFFHHIMGAVDRGAAYVYHAALRVSDNVHAWEEGNPELAAVAEEGVVYATNLLERQGVPVAQGAVIAEDVWAALKLLAAQDPTVPSLPGAANAAETRTAPPAIEHTGA